MVGNKFCQGQYQDGLVDVCRQMGQEYSGIISGIQIVKDRENMEDGLVGCEQSDEWDEWQNRQ